MRGLYDEMAVMVVCRIASLAVGLLMIPLLLHYIGGDQFAAWALYVTVGLAFSTLEAASSATLVRFVAPAARERAPEEIGVIVTNVSVILLVAYAFVLPLVVAGAAPAARAIRLPVGGLISPPTMIVLLYLAAALRSLMLPGQMVLLAGGDLRWYSISSLGLALGGNVTAVVVAPFFPHADAIVAASWTVQLTLLFAYYVHSRRRYSWRIRTRYLDRRMIRGVLRHDLQLQLREWAHFFNFQFDKFLISALSGLWGVGPFEVANRAALALRSVPHSSLELLLPVAAGDHQERQTQAGFYRDATRYAAFAALLFIGVPLAMGWYFMFAWAGETGYYARWAFPALGLSVFAAVIAIPAALMLQAEGRPDVEARAAGISVLINLPMSVLLIPRFGAAGASLAIGVATATGALWILHAFHRLHGLSLRATVLDLWGIARGPALAVVTAGIASAVSFKVWLTPLLPVTGYSADARMIPATLAAGIGLVLASVVLLTARNRLGLGLSGARKARKEAAGSAADGSPGVVR